ncbi:MAG: hypothetical protein NC400_01785 [Clostridium sp.]|nr:hypothetical protein [Clostridium sp.]
MLSVLLIWMYMLFTCYVTGFACVRGICGKENPVYKRESSYLYAGVGFVTVYSQFFSLVGKVGLAANLILLLVCFVCIILFKKELAADFYSLRLTAKPARTAAVVLMLLLFAYGTSTGIIHYDTGLYHAQSIRWIEEYGAVPGLGNLHSRLAYNSAAFCLSALYSMAFLGGQSYHCCAGFLAFLLALVCMEAVKKDRVRKPLLSDFARLVSVYYLLNVFDEMISPASDYFMVLLVLYIVIRWLELLEREETSYLPFAMLCLLCVIVLTIKLSGALILLLALKPAVMMIREKQGKDIVKFLGLGALTAAPFLARNAVLSGWLVYPFTFIDLFSFDFKIPKSAADYDAREIQVWGRGYSDVGRYDEPVRGWLPDWIRSLDGTNKVFLAMAAGGIALFVCLALYGLLKRKKGTADFLHVAGTLAACFLFWLFSAPLIRYGCVFLWLFPALVWGKLYLYVSPHLDRFRLYFIGLAFLSIYKLGAFGLETGRSLTAEYLVKQKDYENFETIPYELHGYTFYYPAEGDRTGYRDFPASPVKLPAPEEGDIFRGEKIEDGFRDVIHGNDSPLGEK